MSVCVGDMGQYIDNFHKRHGLETSIFVSHGQVKVLYLPDERIMNMLQYGSRWCSV